MTVRQNIQQRSVNYTYVNLIDPKDGDSLWSDSKRWGNLYNGFHSATKGLVDRLMKRINEQSASTNAKK